MRQLPGPILHVIRTLAAAAGTMLAASFVIFVALALAPGDPVSQILGPRASDAQRAQMRDQLGLDDPVLVRYWHWLTGALRGDFGTSLTYREDVSALLEPRILTTALLVLMATILILLVGLSLGTLGGTSDRWRPAVNALVGLGVAIPGFIAGSALISLFAVRLGWFPTFGAGSGFTDRVWHLTLPAIALAMGWSAYVAQMTSAAVSEENKREHVLTARGRGISRASVFRRHVLLNASIPVLTASGLTVAGLVAGSVVVESVFAIDGLGSLLVKSVSSKDYAPVTAISMIIVAVFVIVTTTIDLAQVALDPRLRKQTR
ncbi:MAG: ABC transporter permease [Nocardioides sp.]|uniref:ABC transporter permease n=1 Tax=Nocardioides sp. TaxID=35761 RepID=UPI0032657821